MQTAVDNGLTQTLIVAKDAMWVQLPGGKRLDLTRRKVLRRVLLRLVSTRAVDCARGLDTAELIEAGWPGERMCADAASNRLYVTIARLRQLGLSCFLLQNKAGYFLDPAISIRFTD